MAGRRKIAWTDPALQDLREMGEHIRRTNPSAARELASKIRKAVNTLRGHPLSGRIVPELAGHGCREVIVAPYRIVCEVGKRRVTILRVWHGPRDLSRME
jgi:addiction module RelE/StbE family toxin